MSIDNQDFAQKRALGYRDRKSRVYTDGRERLAGRDWTKRKKELAERSGGRCERILKGDWGYRGVASHRCLNQATEPHHCVLRSKERDDRMSNLLDVCHWCHCVLDFEQREQIRNSKKELRSLAWRK